MAIFTYIYIYIYCPLFLGTSMRMELHRSAREVSLCRSRVFVSANTSYYKEAIDISLRLKAFEVRNIASIMCSMKFSDEQFPFTRTTRTLKVNYICQLSETVAVTISITNRQTASLQLILKLYFFLNNNNVI